MNEQQTLDQTATPVVEYSRTAAALAELRQRYANARYDVATTAGMKAARAARAELRDLRVGLEAKRQELKRPLLDRGNLLDSEAKRITAVLVELEDPIDAQIKAEESRKEAELAAKERAEAERRAVIGQRLQWLNNRLVEAVGKPAAALLEMREQLAALPVTDELYGDRVEEARALIEKIIARLAEMQAAVVAQEAEAARLAEERRKIDEARAAAAKEEAARRERVAREDAERKARQDAEDAARLAAQREADKKAEAERQRVARIRGAIEEMRRLGTPAPLDSAAAIRERIERVTAALIDAMEFATEAKQTRASLLAGLQRDLAIAIEREEAAAKEQARRQEEAEARRQECKALEAAADPWAAIRRVLQILDDPSSAQARIDAAQRTLLDTISAYDKWATRQGEQS